MELGFLDKDGDPKETAIAAMQWLSYRDRWQTTLLLQDSCVDAGSAKTKEESLAQAREYYLVPDPIDVEKFEAIWRKRHPIVGNKAHLFSNGPKLGLAMKGAPTTRPTKRARANVVPVPDTLRDEDWLAPVQAAKYLGVPPQYVYQKISKGRLETRGERPKQVQWGAVRRCFGTT